MSKISWTSRTWNYVTGCNKVSPGCKNCYAESMAKWLRAMNNPSYKNGFDLTIQKRLLLDPFKWKPSLVFVNSMSDAFHEEIPLDVTKRAFRTMNYCGHCDFQILTKRTKHLLKVCNELKWSKNIWMGTSIENSDYLWRIDDLRQVEAKIRFLSIEPLLGEIQDLDLSGIQWVIVGGESGRKARPVNKEWVERIQAICQEQEVPFYFKQWGKAIHNPNGSADPTTKKDHPYYEKGGRMLNGMVYNQYPKGKSHLVDWNGNVIINKEEVVYE